MRTSYTGIKLTNDFNESAWYDFHQGAFDDQDGFHVYFREYVDNETIRTWKCKEIVEALNYDVFAIHEVFGRPNSWQDAGHNALYDHLMETGVTWTQIEKEINNQFL